MVSPPSVKAAAPSSRSRMSPSRVKSTVASRASVAGKVAPQPKSTLGTFRRSTPAVTASGDTTASGRGGSWLSSTSASRQHAVEPKENQTARRHLESSLSSSSVSNLSSAKLSRTGSVSGSLGTLRYMSSERGTAVPARQLEKETSSSAPLRESSGETRRLSSNASSVLGSTRPSPPLVSSSSSFSKSGRPSLSSATPEPSSLSSSNKVTRQNPPSSKVPRPSLPASQPPRPASKVSRPSLGSLSSQSIVQNGSSKIASRVPVSATKASTTRGTTTSSSTSQSSPTKVTMQRQVFGGERVRQKEAVQPRSGTTQTATTEKRLLTSSSSVTVRKIPENVSCPSIATASTSSPVETSTKLKTGTSDVSKRRTSLQPVSKTSSSVKLPASRRLSADRDSSGREKRPSALLQSSTTSTGFLKKVPQKTTTGITRPSSQRVPFASKASSQSSKPGYTTSSPRQGESSESQGNADSQVSVSQHQNSTYRVGERESDTVFKLEESAAESLSHLAGEDALQPEDVTPIAQSDTSTQRVSLGSISSVTVGREEVLPNGPPSPVKPVETLPYLPNGVPVPSSIGASLAASSLGSRRPSGVSSIPLDSLLSQSRLTLQRRLDAENRRVALRAARADREHHQKLQETKGRPENPLDEGRFSRPPDVPSSIDAAHKAVTVSKNDVSDDVCAREPQSFLSVHALTSSAVQKMNVLEEKDHFFFPLIMSTHRVFDTSVSQGKTTLWEPPPISSDEITRLSARPKENALPKHVTVSHKASVSALAVFRGEYPITIGANTVVHPGVYLCSEKGPIVIGTGTIFQELVILRNRSTEPLLIGNNNLLETGAEVFDGAQIGNANILGPKCMIMENARVTTGCTIEGGAIVLANAVISPGSVVVGKTGIVTNNMDGSADMLTVLQTAAVEQLVSVDIPTLEQTLQSAVLS